MKGTKPGPPPGVKCECGHRYDEHVPGGSSHACQHGAEPPYKDLCPCKRFRPVGGPSSSS